MRNEPLVLPTNGVRRFGVTMLRPAPLYEGIDFILRRCSRLPTCSSDRCVLADGLVAFSSPLCSLLIGSTKSGLFRTGLGERARRSLRGHTPVSAWLSSARQPTVHSPATGGWETRTTRMDR